MPGSLAPCERRTVTLAGKTTVTTNICGEIILPFEKVNIRLQKALYIPQMGYNLVSTGCLADNCIESYFGRTEVRLIMAGDGSSVGSGLRDGRSGMYKLPDSETHALEEKTFVTAEAHSQAETDLWHRRLTHKNFRDLGNMHKYADGIPELVHNEDVCRACRLGKAHKLPFPGHFQRAHAVGDIVHSDTVGPLVWSFPANFKYACTFMDDYSRYLVIACMGARSQLSEAYEKVSAKFFSIGGVRISGIHSDGAKEYLALQNHLGGVDEENKSFAPPYTPELNGIAERVNRTLEEGARALLIQANLPHCLWPFALKYVCFVRNRVPHGTVGETPYSIVTGKRPDLKNLRVFGCRAYGLRLPRGTKFESRAVEGVYLETIEHGMYRILVVGDDCVPRIMESRHVTFDESMFPGAPALESYSDSDSWLGEESSCDGSISDGSSDSNDSGDEAEVSLDDRSDDDSDKDTENQKSPAYTHARREYGVEENFNSEYPD